MSFFTPDIQRNQTAWGASPQGAKWLAYVDAPISDEVVIEQAKQIVDHCSPQRYGPHGTHGYSFLKREYLLNLLLFHYADFGYFPSGHICITDQWLYGNAVSTSGASWFGFSPRAKGRNYEPGWWIKVPSLQEIELNQQEVSS